MADPKIDRFTRQVQDLTASLDAFESRLDSMGGGSASSPGTFTGTMNRGRFGSGVNFLQNSMGTLGAVAGTAATGMVASSLLMPDVGTAMAREATFYETGLRTGRRMTRTEMGDAVGGSVMPYLSFAGADAVSAATLASGGILPGSTAMGTMGGGGLFELAARTSSNLTGLFNVDTAEAAASQAQFYSGGTAASLLRAGVFSRDPATGQQLSQTQIFEQLSNRLIRRDLTAEELGEELRSGMLGSQIEALPFDALTKDMFTTFLFDQTQGRTTDFSDADYVSDAIGESEEQGFRNIYREESELQRTEADLMTQGAQQFYEGAVTAYDALIGLKDEAGKTAEQFGAVTSGLQVFFGNRAGQGLLTALSSPQASAATALLVGTGMLGAAGAAAVESGDLGEDNPLYKIFSGDALDISLSNLFGLGDNVGEDGGFEQNEVLKSVNVLPGYASATVTSNYGEQRSTGAHGGIDIAASKGTPVGAARSGEIVESKTGSGTRSYGNYVKIKHDNGYYSLYAHLDSRKVQVGDYVTEGDEIGTVGDTGFASGDHLHFEVRNAQNEKINPAAMLEVATGGGYETFGDVTVGERNSARAHAGNNITISVNVQQASEAEAIRLAQIVKRELQKNDMNERMASR